MIRAVAFTGSYTWTVVAESIEAANAALLEAYRHHVAVCAAAGFMAEPDIMANLIAADEVDYEPLVVGKVVRS